MNVECGRLRRRKVRESNSNPGHGKRNLVLAHCLLSTRRRPVDLAVSRGSKGSMRTWSVGWLDTQLPWCQGRDGLSAKTEAILVSPTHGSTTYLGQDISGASGVRLPTTERNVLVISQFIHLRAVLR